MEQLTMPPSADESEADAASSESTEEDPMKALIEAVEKQNKK